MIIEADVIREIVDDMKKHIAPIQSASGPLAIFKAVAEAVPHVIHKVEEVSATLKSRNIDLASADKKQIALDILFALVPLPIWLPRSLAEMIAGFIIDSAVAAVNKARGKK